MTQHSQDIYPFTSPPLAVGRVPAKSSGNDLNLCVLNASSLRGILHELRGCVPRPAAILQGEDCVHEVLYTPRSYDSSRGSLSGGGRCGYRCRVGDGGGLVSFRIFECTRVAAPRHYFLRVCTEGGARACRSPGCRSSSPTARRQVRHDAMSASQNHLVGSDTTSVSPG